MKLSNRYNKANILTSIVVLIITGVIYYVVIHFILTEKLDRDLAVEENEITHLLILFIKFPYLQANLNKRYFIKP